MATVRVIGAGSWGTALSILLHSNGHEVTLWSIMEAEVAMLNEQHEHKDKLPGVKLPEDMHITTDLESSIKGVYVIGDGLYGPWYWQFLPPSPEVRLAVWRPLWRMDRLL